MTLLAQVNNYSIGFNSSASNETQLTKQLVIPNNPHTSQRMNEICSENCSSDESDSDTGISPEVLEKLKYVKSKLKEGKEELSSLVIVAQSNVCDEDQVFSNEVKLDQPKINTVKMEDTNNQKKQLLRLLYVVVGVVAALFTGIAICIVF